MLATPAQRAAELVRKSLPPKAAFVLVVVTADGLMDIHYNLNQDVLPNVLRMAADTVRERDARRN